MNASLLSEADRTLVLFHLRAGERDHHCFWRWGTSRHNRTCQLGSLMRIFGGAEEVRRQVDASHEDATTMEVLRCLQLLEYTHLRPKDRWDYAFEDFDTSD